MWSWIGQSLRRKLTIIIVISTLVPLLLLGAFTYVFSSNLTEQKMNQSGRATLAQMEGKLSFIINDIENISLFLIGHSDIQSYLSGSDEDGLRARILNLMMNLSTSKNYIFNITMYPKQSSETLSSQAIFMSNLSEQVQIDKVEEKMWSGIYTVTNYSGRHQIISLIRPMRSVYTYENLGWLVISLDEQVLARYWAESGFGDGEVALLNEQGVVLSATDNSWLGHSFDELYPGAWASMSHPASGETIFGEGADKKTIVYYRQPATGWMFAGTIPYEQYKAQNGYILLLTAAAVIVTLIVNGGLVFVVIKGVTNPLRVLTRLLTKVNVDAPLPVYHAATRDEIGRLGESYNRLGQHIAELKEQLIRNEARKKEADIRALQAQINPHFLYNTLSSIHWMALMTKEKRIADMVGALSDFLQFSLNKGNDFCPVHQELAHIRNYTQVQSIRYPDKFEVDISIDSTLENKLMLKLLLQPLIENAMIHGIQKKQGIGTIGVYVKRDEDRISFTVIDDGIGMTEERLRSVKAQIEQVPANIAAVPGESYGLRNVNERLRLHYGNEACLQIESKQHAGTRISFTIPMLEVTYENYDSG